MSSRRRNLIVGAVVLIGLGIIVWMVLLFAGRFGALLAPAGFPVTITADRADGVSDGSMLLYLGQQVGRVTTIRIGSDSRSVIIKAQVNQQPPLPGNLQALIQTQSAFGSAANISLELTGPAAIGTLQPNTTLRAEYEGSGLVPKSFTQIAEELHNQHLIEHLDQAVVSIREQSERAGQLLGSIQGLIGDNSTRENLRTALANIRAASDSAARVGANFERFSGNLEHLDTQADATLSQVRLAAARLGSALDHVDSVAAKLDQGKGTAGMLVNDPKLYQGLVDTVRELNATVSDLQRLIQQWEQEGVSLKLGK